MDSLLQYVLIVYIYIYITQSHIYELTLQRVWAVCMGSALVYLFQTILRNVLTDPPLDNPMNMEAAQLLLLGQETEYVARVHSTMQQPSLISPPWSI
jgi:hypothetical protein